VAQLRSLTALSLCRCRQLQGSTLGQLAAISALVSLNLDDCELTTCKGLELLPALQDLTLPVELEAVALAPLTALTTLTRLEAAYAAITDECSGLLRLPSLGSLTAGSISLTAPPAGGVLQQLTQLTVASSGSLARLLPLRLNLQHLDVALQDHEGAADGDADAEGVAALVAAISRQTGLTHLALKGSASRASLSEQQMQQMVAPLKQLQSFTTYFGPVDNSCSAACAALAELPLLRRLALWRVPQPAHLAMLVRCAGLQELHVDWSADVGGASTGLLAALVCKPGMSWMRYPQREDAAIDDEMLAQIAARARVQLARY
jgi:hypothetical protein